MKMLLGNGRESQEDMVGAAGITPASGFIDSQASLALGALIGLSTFGGVRLIKHRLGVDDALDVSSVHVRNTRCSTRCHTPRFVLRPLGSVG